MCWIWRISIVIKINIKNNKDIEEEHYNDIKGRIEPIFKNLKLDSKYKKLCDYFFDKSEQLIEVKLRKLILGKKNDLIEIIDNIGQISLSKNDEFEKLYVNFTKRNWSKILLVKLNVRVCPYCNRQYTFTLKCDGIRPQFDHFFPKSLFPYLSVSLYNLIPSCGICNLKKSALNTREKDIYYPYHDEFGYDVIFQTAPINNDFLYWTGVSNNFELNLFSQDKTHKEKVEIINDCFKIETLYNEHKDYIVDIIRNAVIYNDSRINELLEEFPDLFNSKEDVINSVFMGYIDNSSWGNRPLSKLTHDIYKEFKINE